ncbi:ATV_HP_G0128160.mRNA.1.CDS.1 [Saccharomyces cerevisiae]|nr:ATV_HP_G0128160.mRNA.1.CDS.1 [Saccharomyces cerevisiae]CAI6841144.1 ATV_HP_G0128160.mRNA.1.CDS.1 [Saccharomyces cerevisiae]
MSWQAYTDNLIGTGKVDKAVIYSRAGDAVWATSGGLSLQPNEIGEIVQGFDNPAGLQSNGLHIQGQKFMLLRADDRSIYGNICWGLFVNSTVFCLSPTVAGEATKIVEQLADYLIGVQY